MSQLLQIFAIFFLILYKIISELFCIISELLQIFGNYSKLLRIISKMAEE